MCLKKFYVRLTVVLNVRLILETLRTVHRVLQKEVTSIHSNNDPLRSEWTMLNSLCLIR